MVQPADYQHNTKQKDEWNSKDVLLLNNLQKETLHSSLTSIK